MKITDRRPGTQKIFGELEIGDIFHDEDGDIMMKINPANNEETNCISLKNGEGYIYYNDHDVTLIINAELVIR